MESSGERAFFDDPVARQTKWTLVQQRGSYILRHKLVRIDHGRMEFRITILSVFACIALLLFGSAFIGSSFSDGQFNSKFIPQTLIGFALLCTGGWRLYSGTVPLVFDKRKGAFWKGRKVPDNPIRRKENSNYVRLERVYALQLISKVTKSTAQAGHQASSVTRYEINLILKDSSRVHVVQHRNKKRIRQDAAGLAEFLGKPLWDASGLHILKGIGSDFVAKWSDIMGEYSFGGSEGVDIKSALKEGEDKIKSDRSRR